MADTVSISFDPNDLTLGEMVEWEEITGRPIGAFSPETVGVRDMIAIVYINGKRTNPNYTLEDAKAVKITQIDTSSMQRNPPAAAPLQKLERPARRRKAAS